MVKSELFLSSTRNIAVMVIPFLLVFVVSVSSQTDLRDVVYGKSKVTNKPAISKNTNKPKPKPTVPKKSVIAVKSTPKTITKKTTKPLIPVIFTAKEELIEVWLNDKNIGKTDANLQLQKNLTPGEYRLMAKNSRQVLISKKITIDEEQNSFELFEKVVPELPIVQPKIEEPKPQEKSQSEIEKEDSLKVKTIFEKYEDPKTTDKITLDDWQFVFKSVNSGQSQGLTAVQIEAQRWFASGKIELDKKEYSNALIAFKKSTEYMPLWAFPYYELGNANLASNQISEAIKLYQKALQLNNKLGIVYKRLGDANRLSGKEKEALSAYGQATQFNYNTFETRYLIAVLHIENKQIEKGMDELKELIKEKPNAELYIKLGEAYEKLKLWVSAIENYQSSISLLTDPSQIHFRIGGLFMNLREYTKAKESIEKAISLDPDGKVLDIKDAQKKLREISSKSNR